VFLNLLALLQQKNMLTDEMCLFVAEYVRGSFESIEVRHVLSYAEFLDSVGYWQDNQ
jgi:hypothetical protein